MMKCEAKTAYLTTLYNTFKPSALQK